MLKLLLGAGSVLILLVDYCYCRLSALAERRWEEQIFARGGEEIPQKTKEKNENLLFTGIVPCIFCEYRRRE